MKRTAHPNQRRLRGSFGCALELAAEQLGMPVADLADVVVVRPADLRNRLASRGSAVV